MAIMPIMGHLKEVRSRLIVCLLVFAAAFIVCWWQSSLLWCWFVDPLAKVLPLGHRMIFTGPSEAFVAYMKIAALAGLVLSWPIWVWNVWRFVAPGLTTQEKPMTLGVLLGSTGFFIMGLFFAYAYVCPAAYQFFISFEMPSAPIPLQLEMRISEYVSFMVRVMTAFGLCAQLPLVMVLCVRYNIVSLSRWMRLARPVCAGIFVVAAVITPPDMLSMLALAVPMCLLYAGTLLFLKWLTRWNSTQKPPSITTTDGPTGQS